MGSVCAMEEATVPSQIELPTCYVGKRTTKEVKKHHVKKKQVSNPLASTNHSEDLNTLAC